MCIPAIVEGGIADRCPGTRRQEDDADAICHEKITSAALNASAQGKNIRTKQEGKISADLALDSVWESQTSQARMILNRK